jgi:hypothetical protein
MSHPDLTAGSFVLPDPNTIRRIAEEVIQRPDYRLDPVGGSSRTLLDLFFEILLWVLTPFRWLFDALEGTPEWMRWLIVIGLAVLLVALVVHIGYTMVTALTGPRRARIVGTEDRRKPPDPATLEQKAEELAVRHDYIGAIRFLFRACLLRLARSEKRAFRPGLTNREYLRRYGGTSMFEGMTLFVETIDSKWYGSGKCVRDDYEACRDAHMQIRRLIREAAHAHGA